MSPGHPSGVKGPDSETGECLCSSGELLGLELCDLGTPQHKEKLTSPPQFSTLETLLWETKYGRPSLWGGWVSSWLALSHFIREGFPQWMALTDASNEVIE